jgi:diguanylate cyclase (GGDEF)-like protein
VSEHAPWVDIATGALRREAFDARTVDAVRLAKRSGTPLSILWIDVDDLFEHNDVHGCEAVDGALSWLVSLLGGVVDGAGPIGRVAGGAFAALLPGIDRERASALSERIRVRIAGRAHRSTSGEYRLTVSVGVASLRRHEPWGNFLEAAQSACLRAKQAGRDGVVAR